MTRSRMILALGCGTAVFAASSKATEWPQFRGQQSAGVAEENFPAQWGPDKNVQWKVKLPGVAWSSPIVWGDKVFVTTATTDNQTKPAAGRGFGGPGRGGGPGGMGGGGMGGGGRGGRGGFGGPPQPGQILPFFLQDRLSLNADQRKQLDQLQKEVDLKLPILLTEEQKKTLKEPPEFGGRGGGRFGGFPQPGQILPANLRDRLKLSDDQKKQADALQKEVDMKLASVLKEDQKKQLETMREGFGRGGRGGMGGGMGGRGGGRRGFGGGSPPNVVYHWRVMCIDRNTGKILWDELALEGKPRIAIQQSNTYATETPVTDGARVYAYFGMHGLYCYDVSGKLLWKKDLGSYPTVMGQGPASSPVIDGERLFLQIDNEEKSFLVALNAKTGDELWRVSREERTNHCSPVVWKNKVRTELVTSGSQKVRSYDPASGKLLWELGMGGGRCYSSPVGDSDLLYVGSEAGFGMGGGGGRGGMGGGRRGRRGNEGDEGPDGDRNAANGAPGGRGGNGGRGGRGDGGAGGEGGRGGRGGAGSGSSGGGGGIYAIHTGASGDVTPKEGESTSAGVAWSQHSGGPEKASPLSYNGHVYLLRTNGGVITCLDAKTGQQIYRQRIPGASAFWSSPWGGEGKVFCLDDSGTTHVLDAGPEFKVLGKNKLNEMFWATPAISDGSVYLRSVDHLYCIRDKGAKK